ncbi:unnamed protein product [Rangifer tarandus platyrhynchus]|uniref:Uncharacterized protein n=1 Tax=Rangifer tarandus platyrhynchus TaxID=3082113 RepID=A0AC59Z1H2_RANTA
MQGEEAGDTWTVSIRVSGGRTCWKQGGRAGGRCLQERILAPPAWPGHVTVPQGPLCRAALWSGEPAAGFRAGHKVPSRQFLQIQAAFLPTLHSPSFHPPSRRETQQKKQHLCERWF